MSLLERDWQSYYVPEVLLSSYHNLTVHFDSSYRETIDLLCSFLYNCYLRRPAGEGRGGSFYPTSVYRLGSPLKRDLWYVLRYVVTVAAFVFFFYATDSETVSLFL